CLICAAEPRAPESDIIHTELTGSPGPDCRIIFSISSATLSVQRDQTSTTLLYFSPCVIRPSWYCCSYCLTWSCASAPRRRFASGTIRLSLPNEMPALHAC